MYHRTIKFARTALILGLAFTGASSVCTTVSSKVLASELELGNLQKQATKALTTEPATPATLTADDKEFPLLPGGRNLHKKKPTNVTVYQQDNSPLGARSPFLFVHGLRGEYYPNFRWHKVVSRLQEDARFNDQYKVYLVRYDSTARIDQIVPQFRQAVSVLSQSAHGRPITAMALSIGGNLLYESMLDKNTRQAIRLALTLGTPFHGSPLFNKEWIQYSVYKNFAMPWTRVDHSLAFKLYFHRNPNLLKDFNWDDVDNAIPSVGHFLSYLPFGPHGTLIAEDDRNTRLAALDDENFNKKKLICYGSYLANSYMSSKTKRIWQTMILAPYAFVTMKVPAHLAREHAVLKLLNCEIASVVGSASAVERAGTPFLYQLNDGISPVVSALFLPDSALQMNALAQESDMPTIKELADVRIARVFRNADHLTFIDGFRPLHKKSLWQDELNPDAGTHHIFDWMLTDILHNTEPIDDVVHSDAPPTVQPVALGK